MQPGDLVRFHRGGDADLKNTCVGLLVEYETWEKVARILYKGQVIMIHGSMVEKAGKKDEACYESHDIKNKGA